MLTNQRMGNSSGNLLIKKLPILMAYEHLENESHKRRALMLRAMLMQGHQKGYHHMLPLIPQSTRSIAFTVALPASAHLQLVVLKALITEAGENA